MTGLWQVWPGDDSVTPSPRPRLRALRLSESPLGLRPLRVTEAELLCQ